MDSKPNRNYYKDLRIRYVTCLDCDFRYKIFNPKDLKRQKCYDNMCNSYNTKFRDFKPNYKDKIKCYGRYECIKCKNLWTSYSTWIFYKLRCSICKKKNYPIVCQDILDYDSMYGIKILSGKKHEMENCEFCIKIGRLCTREKGNDFRYFPQ